MKKQIPKWTKIMIAILTVFLIVCIVGAVLMAVELEAFFVLGLVLLIVGGVGMSVIGAIFYFKFTC